MEKVVAIQLGKRIARMVAGHMASEAHTNMRGWGAIDADVRSEIVDTWSAAIVELLQQELPSGDIDELLQALAEERGWGPLLDRALKLWKQDYQRWGMPPTWGPTEDRVVDCICEGKQADCVWCENTGKLTPAVKKLLIETQGGKLTGGESSADPKESVYHRVHHLFDLFSCGRNLDVKNVQFRDGDGSTFSMEFQPPEPKARRCPNDGLPMVESWHCDSCGHTERD